MFHFIPLILLSFFSFSAEPPVVAVISEIKGRKYIIAKTAKTKKKYKAYVHDELAEGTSVYAPSGTTIGLTFSNGFQSTVTEKTHFVVQAHDGHPLIHLFYGKIRSFFAKEDQTPHEFYIKTSEAVSGVRGTDFFVEHQKGKETSVHSIEGHITVGHKPHNLWDNHIVKVKPGEFTRGTKKDISRFKQRNKFNRKEYLNKHSQLHPHAANMKQSLVKNRVQHKQRFKNLRQKQIQKRQDLKKMDRVDEINKIDSVNRLDRVDRLEKLDNLNKLDQLNKFDRLKQMDKVRDINKKRRRQRRIKKQLGN